MPAALEFVNLHTLPCGCRFLLAWEETRERAPAGSRERWVDKHDPATERQYRIVTQEEAEAVVDGKRAHPDWKDFVHSKGVPQPMPQMCPLHTSVPYTKGGYQQVVNDPVNQPTV